MEKPKSKFELPKVTRRDALIGGVSILLGGLLGAGVMDKLTPEQFEPITGASESMSITIDWLPSTILYYKDLIEENAKKYNVDANLIAILMTIESGGFSRAGSEDEARGLMQITPIAEGDIISVHLQTPIEPGTYDIYDPVTNVEFGVAQMNWIRNEIVEKYPTIPDSMLVESIAMAYNGGLEGSAYPFLRGEGVVAGEAAFYGRTTRSLYIERDAAKGIAYERWRELDAQQGNFVGKAEAEQAGR